ncbi:LADA_0F15192g1_1 [Lachancea dasiensis]|uniref:DNA mismatch repair protein MSH3 n=1 Tax=Lachancea dasiensis TaxID=1072105 RepID=A0A1G4JNL3_9SACH|nr:LADA_0F15192g1_1 [Lachancea dasiensis]
MPYQPAISKFFKSNSNKSNSNKVESFGAESAKSGPEERVNESPKGVQPQYRPDPTQSVSSTTPVLQEFNFSKSNGHETPSTRLSSNDSLLFSSKVSEALRKRASGTIDRDADRENSIEVEEELPAAKRQKAGKLTPLDQQVKELKLLHMDKILAVRVGYKYKFFAMDAVTVSKILQIMLIKGKISLDDSSPEDKSHRQLAYCSIPENRLQVHLQRLLHHNLKVGVVEQVETQAIKKVTGTSSGVFRRQVDKVFTKATFDINETFNGTDIDHREKPNSIWALKVEESGRFCNYWILSVQLTSGEIIYDSFSDRVKSKTEIDKRISYLNPIEVVLANDVPSFVVNFLKLQLPEINFQMDDTLIPEDADDDAFKGLDLDPCIHELRSKLRRYLESYNTEKVLDMPHNYKPFSTMASMLLSPNTLESLEIFENQTDHTRKGSLLWLLDHTRTSYGYRLLREWISKPLIDIAAINDRLDGIECLKQEITNIFMEGLSNSIKDTPDLLRNLNRLSYGQTSRKEVYYFLKHLDIVAKHFTNHHYYFQDNVVNPNGRVHKSSTLLTSVLLQLDDALREVDIAKLLSMINTAAVVEKDKEKKCVEFFNLTNYDQSDEITSKMKDIENVREQLKEELDAIRRLLKRPRFCFRDEVDYLIEVRNSQLAGLPKEWVKVSSTKVLSRFRTPETTKLVEQVEYHKSLLMVICEEHFRAFLGRISKHHLLLKQVIENLAKFDCLLSLAASSLHRNYVRPKFNDDMSHVKVRNGRNPIIESLDVNYVANDIYMKRDQNKVMIITGPNMGGKSSFIRQVALISILAQIGSFVPADTAELPIFESIFTRIGAHDNLVKGDSTFKVEMLEMLDIIKNSGERSLLLLDEVGRGTGTTDGISISYSIINYFLDLKRMCPFILFITHYPILGSIQSPLLQNYHMAYMEEKRSGEKWPTVVFLYRLKQGPAHNSYGLNVARLARVPTDIINKAYELSERSKAEMESEKNLHFISLLKTILSSKESSHQQKVSRLLEM